MTNHSQQILQYLAELAPTGSKVVTDVALRATEFAYLGWRPDLIYQPLDIGDNGKIPRITASKEIRRLAVVDTLHSEEQLLRIGWLFVTGRHQLNGENKRFCLPLLSSPVRLESIGRKYKVIPLGDFDMPADFFSDEDQAEMDDWHELRNEIMGAGLRDPIDETSLDQLPGFRRWVANATIRAGLHPAFITGSGVNPLVLRNQEGLSVAGESCHLRSARCKFAKCCGLTSPMDD